MRTGRPDSSDPGEGAAGPRRARPVSLLAGLALAAIFSFFYWHSWSAPQAGEPTLRIRLDSLGGPAWLRPAGQDLRMLDPMGRQLPSREGGALRACGGALLDEAGRPLPQPLRLQARGPIVLEPAGRSWSGVLEVRARGECLEIHDTLSMEDYLPGVVAGELGDAWPWEALLAQAIAARTYALWTHGERRAAPFHLTDTAHYQVFLGFVDPDRPVGRAVRATRGQILRCGAALLPAWFSSTCGGRTSPAWEVFPGAPRLAALAGVVCPWCAGAAHFRWSVGPFPPRLLNELFGLPPGEQPTRLEPEQVDSAGRWRTARLIVPGGFGSVPMGTLRAVLGLKSSLLFQARPAPGGFLLEGGGFGHGAGLCQVGAARMAAAGKDHREILSFYYPGTTLEQAW